MYILTDVPEVYIDFHTEHQRPLRRMTVAEAQGHLDEGQFPAGSMGPKVAAAIQFIKQGGHRVVVTDIATIAQAHTGAGGTHIYD